MEFYGGTDIGKVRTANQDSYYIDSENCWAVVADGMGGHRGGETASSMTVNIIKDSMSESQELVRAIESANSKVFEKSVKETEYSGMGTTVVLCKISGNTATIAHVGDSRAYLVTHSGMKQVTTDHSIVQQLIDSGTITKEQAKYHPQRNLITRAVGTEKDVAVDVNTTEFNEGDLILLCSDGLSSYVDEDDIHNIITNNPTDTAVLKLIDAANETGGRDNVTIVLIKA